MDLRKWLDEQGRGALSELARVTGLSHPTIYSVIGGGNVRAETARLIREATGGSVKIPKSRIVPEPKR